MHVRSAEKVLGRYCTQDGEMLAAVQRRIISLPPLLSTSIRGNLAELRLCQRFPFLFAGTSAPPAAHAHRDSGWLVIYTILIQRQIPSVIIEYLYVPGSDLAQHTCSFSSPSCFVFLFPAVQCFVASTVGHCKAPWGILRFNCLTPPGLVMKRERYFIHPSVFFSL